MWTFAGVPLLVTDDGGGPIIIPQTMEDVREYPGVDKADITPDHIRPTLISVTILARTDAEHETLEAMFGTGTIGDLERPVAGDYWVYAGAKATRVEVGKYPDGRRKLEVTFTCPDPFPARKSTGVKVFST